MAVEFSIPDTTDIVTQEPGLIEMSDGDVMMYIRTNGDFSCCLIHRTRGKRGVTLKQAIYPPLYLPLPLKRFGTGDWLLVWNNNDGSNPEIKDKRTPLTMAISKDEGKTWEKIKNIHDDPDGWYCYIAIHFVDNDNALLGYCAGSQSRNTHLSVSNITLLTKEWMYGE